MATPWWPCENLEGLVSQGGGAELGLVWFLGHLLPSLHQPLDTVSFAVLLPASDTTPNLRGDKADFAELAAREEVYKHKFNAIEACEIAPGCVSGASVGAGG